jgi:hypothetical protein
MRKSIIIGLTLCAALVVAEQSQANDTDRTASTHRRHDARKANRAGETPASPFRIPAQPAVRDCAHVMFPQCSPRGGMNFLDDGPDRLNDGTFNGDGRPGR